MPEIVEKIEQVEMNSTLKLALWLAGGIAVGVAVAALLATKKPATAG